MFLYIVFCFLSDLSHGRFYTSYRPFIGEPRAFSSNMLFQRMFILVAALLQNCIELPF